MARRLTRRQFLAGAAGAGVAGYVVATHPWDAVFSGASSASLDGNGKLVVVTLYGGNDGLNTVVPAADGRYQSARGSLAYHPDQVLGVGDGLGLNPNLKALKGVWDRRQLAIVRGVGYPNPNRSHFRSMDIWQSGDPGGTSLSGPPTGWLGRWQDATGADALRSLAVGATVPRLLAGEKTSASAVPAGRATFPDNRGLLAAYTAMSRVSSADAPWAARVAQTNAGFLSVQHAVHDALAHQPSSDSGGTNLEGAPAGSTASGGQLGGQLDLVTRLMKARLPTRVYAVSLGGFDTHTSERDTHDRLLGQLDAALGRFLGSLHEVPDGQRTVVFMYSEFGRRVAANASAGTDHGTAAPVLVAGPGVKGGFYGDQPSLSDLDDGDLRFTTDLRAVYATLLAHVLGVDPTVAVDRRFRPMAFL